VDGLTAFEGNPVGPFPGFGAASPLAGASRNLTNATRSEISEAVGPISTWHAALLPRPRATPIRRLECQRPEEDPP